MGSASAWSTRPAGPAIRPYEGLAADNSKAHWSDHKTVYDDQIRAPMVALLDELEPEFGTGKIFRPHRDVRFSNDKSPYKTHCGAVISVPGGAFYTQVGADGLLVDHPRMDLLRHRSLYLWRSWPPDEMLHERACLIRIQETWRTTRPLVEWLAGHVGAAEI